MLYGILSICSVIDARRLVNRTMCYAGGSPLIFLSMFLTVHAVAGEVAAQLFTTNPFVAFLIGFASHFFVDALPHGDEDLGASHQRNLIRFLITLTLVDLSMMVVTQALLWRANLITNPAVLVAAFGAMLPDGLQVPDIVFPKGPAIFRWYRRAHERFHNIVGIHLGIKKGLLWQALVFVILIFLL